MCISQTHKVKEIEKSIDLLEDVVMRHIASSEVLPTTVPLLENGDISTSSDLPSTPNTPNSSKLPTYFHPADDMITLGKLLINIYLTFKLLFYLISFTK